jgi:hypothetical protein
LKPLYKELLKLKGRDRMNIRRFAVSIFIISGLLAGVASARAEVKNVQMKIAGYLCGN